MAKPPTTITPTNPPTAKLERMGIKISFTNCVFHATKILPNEIFLQEKSVEKVAPEYRAPNTTVFWILHLHVNFRQKNEISIFLILHFSLCGLTNFTDGTNLDQAGNPLSTRQSPSRRIIGGLSTQDMEIPWQVGLNYDGRFGCGGSLVTMKVSVYTSEWNIIEKLQFLTSKLKNWSNKICHSNLNDAKIFVHGISFTQFFVS